ncbi:hypothetical protein BDA96_10G196000 [Sorghum bicolor]|uniref:Uncharacterized protein n=1 Tax=Sorghum bicolor TaxID=4558 RepID=A0A921Q3D9_SORBI|nr:hypothetical protein BDA96_10G196000 [Sorghum bicolor]
MGASNRFGEEEATHRDRIGRGGEVASRIAVTPTQTRGASIERTSTSKSLATADDKSDQISEEETCKGGARRSGEVASRFASMDRRASKGRRRRGMNRHDSQFETVMLRVDPAELRWRTRGR